jgi:hypothetical protein
VLQQGLVDGEIGEVRADLLLLVRAELLVLVTVLVFQRQGRVLRVAREGVRWQGIR